MDTTDADSVPSPSKPPALSVPFVRKTLIVLWLLACVLTAVAFVYPEKLNAIRAITVGGFFCIWAGAAILWWRLIPVRIAVVLAAVGAALIALVPGRQVAPSALQAQYTKSLIAYEGSPYMWGGESSLGIDCSGLIRRGMIDANLTIGVHTLNPRALRDAFAIYWRDCSASDLGLGYGGRTRLVEEAKTIDSIDPATLQPGDIATTMSGAHILAYLGGNVWINADPKAWRVEQVHVPAPTNGWFTQHARVMRWRALEPSPPAPLSPAPGT